MFDPHGIARLQDFRIREPRIGHVSRRSGRGPGPIG
jgi:hypothetical protein